MLPGKWEQPVAAMVHAPRNLTHPPRNSAEQTTPEMPKTPASGGFRDLLMDVW